MEFKLSGSMQQAAQAAWRDYLALIEPFRADLSRYCRRLTGDIWDAEDLSQDTLLKGFALLGSTFHAIEKPGAYLLRIATNLWIDTYRRRVLEDATLQDAALRPEAMQSPAQENAAAVRQAGSVLLQFLAPQERAAVLLKDVFDMSLEESASILGTTPGAVKSALHRGRERLKETAQAAPRPLPDPAVVDKFAERYNARDLDGLVALMLDSASIEMGGINNEFGREGFTRHQGWFFHTVIGFPGEFEPPKLRWERRAFRGEPLIVQFSTIGGREVVTSLLRFDTEDSKVARLRCYTFCPDAIREVTEALGLTLGPAFYSFEPFRAFYASLRPDPN
jgi:RNA polymerase sigma-70 factor (ECF subfamily)